MKDGDKDKDVAADFLDYVFGPIIEKIFIAVIAVVAIMILSIFFVGKVFGLAGLLVVLFLIFTPAGHTLAVLLMSIFIKGKS